ncbi:hypothetical protein HBH98_199030 [Parastagonospora nodorum]|nr:hypothetical protein HBI09_223070 [Parastagonospora nodorum]KAH4339820.1 hypothetical protein HBH98_199030 [Parastagonospora nodorum]KAH4357434.1 hypothetical protein HBH97_223840 [Parastagonospora nodorum]KAH4371372.1 hypothetical protein HBH99_235630 [Parastagonospora nodorum]KAH4892564.1 hypothetical protein HBH74_207750 [Parastagonospora nodorum]
MVHLLELPREVLHMIIDQALLNPSTHSPTAHTTISNRVLFFPGWTEPTRFAPFSPQTWPKIPPFHHALLHTCSALRHETLYRAKSLQSHVPLTIDSTLLPNGTVRHTWLSRPHGEPASWKRIEILNITLKMPLTTTSSPIPPEIQESVHIEALFTAVRDVLAVIVYPGAPKSIGRLNLRVFGTEVERVVSRAFLKKFGIDTSVVGPRTRRLLSFFERVVYTGDGMDIWDSEWKIRQIGGKWVVRVLNF